MSVPMTAYVIDYHDSEPGYYLLAQPPPSSSTHNFALTQERDCETLLIEGNSFKVLIIIPLVFPFSNGFSVCFSYKNENIDVIEHVSIGGHPL